MSSAKFSLEFLGSGTSVGVPVIGCDCAVCTSNDTRNQRLRSSALVKAFDESGSVTTTVLIDTTPDFRMQMLRARVRRIDAVIISHFHADHVVGIDDIRRFNSIQNSVIDCWCTPKTEEALRRSFGYVFGDLRPGLPCLKARSIVFGEPFEIGALKFEPLRLDHHVMDTAGFKISVRGSSALAYCLDVKRIPPDTISALRGTDTLILDMLREKIHPTHMNLEEAMTVVKQIEPRRTWFGHIAHEVDHALLESKLPPEIRIAYDGLVIEM
ncbi:MAG TPA: MBL fold metallo-hydrolase [Planctomycetota bacterium]|nr:MBL fold metallo-hydrolase [Planctomycetota bacterium]